MNKTDQLLEVLSRFSMNLHMLARDFDQQIVELKTGVRIIRGNDAVALGQVEIHPKKREKRK